MQQCILLVRTVPGTESCAGCRMTELGHGSNVMGIETQATYDEQSMEFVITTPRDTASKFWIGGAAQHGKVTIAALPWPVCLLCKARLMLLTKSLCREAPAGERLSEPRQSARLSAGAVQQSADKRACGQVCTVFAQLTVRGKWEGPHVFVVRIRDDSGRPTPGVRILDNGPKVRLMRHRVA